MKDEVKEILDKLNKLEYDDVHLIICEVISRREIKQLLDYITNLRTIEQQYSAVLSENAELENNINNLQEENEKLKDEIYSTNQVVNELLDLKEQNNDLRKIYRNTYNKLFENGNDELAYYFQAQIDDCPTFYVEPIIDYHKEYEKYKSRNEKAIEYINKYFIFEDTGACYQSADFDSTNAKELYDILGGDDNE